MSEEDQSDDVHQHPSAWVNGPNHADRTPGNFLLHLPRHTCLSLHTNHRMSLPNIVSMYHIPRKVFVHKMKIDRTVFNFRLSNNVVGLIKPNRSTIVI